MIGSIMISPSYPLSMTGIQAGGKGTLRDALAVSMVGYEPVRFHLLQLGRMVDLEGLPVFRQRYFEQDTLVRRVTQQGRQPVTSRLGVLDVAVVTCVMVRLGRIDETGAGAFLERVARDFPALLFPRSLVAVMCEPTDAQARLAARDEAGESKPSRGLKALTAMAAILKETYVDGHSPHWAVQDIVEHYRKRDRLLVVDTTELDKTAALELVTSFVQTMSDD